MKCIAWAHESTGQQVPTLSSCNGCDGNASHAATHPGMASAESRHFGSMSVDRGVASLWQRRKLHRGSMAATTRQNQRAQRSAEAQEASLRPRAAVAGSICSANRHEPRQGTSRGHSTAGTGVSQQLWTPRRNRAELAVDQVEHWLGCKSAAGLSSYSCHSCDSWLLRRRASPVPPNP